MNALVDIWQQMVKHDPTLALWLAELERRPEDIRSIEIIPGTWIDLGQEHMGYTGHLGLLLHFDEGLPGYRALTSRSFVRSI